MKILGFDYFTGSDADCLAALHRGGLVLAPSGPGLGEDLVEREPYRQAGLHGDLILPDSGLMVGLWNLLHAGDPSKKLERFSGLRLLRLILGDPEVQAPGASLWAMPSPSESAHNLAWLRANGFAHLRDEDCYLAPDYRNAVPGSAGRVEKPAFASWSGPRDWALVERIHARRPRYVFLNVGGGVQEPLGYWLREHLEYRPAILCTGAAIAFLTGLQANIPVWADRVYLGWLLRIASNPAKYAGRYWRARRLVTLLLRYRDRLPPLSAAC